MNFSAFRARALQLLAVCVLWGCAPSGTHRLEPLSFDQLAQWEQAAHLPALEAFRRSCDVPFVSPATSIVPVDVPAQQRACNQAQQMVAPDAAQARIFFETHFTPHRIHVSGAKDTLFTGYYIPVLRGSLTPSARYFVPLYALPAECANAPCHTRSAIDKGALTGRGLEQVWLEDPVMAFFLHIQGSGHIMLPDGRMLTAAYAGNNGQEYYAIGHALAEMGAIEKQHLSLETIREWLRTHPQRQQEIMQRNPRYIFFSLQPQQGGVKGAQGVPLTARHSLAIDSRLLPYGLPIYAALPPDNAFEGFHTLTITQDTGSAITGFGRADIFFGAGAQAELDSSAFAHRGEMLILLPGILSHE